MTDSYPLHDAAKEGKIMIVRNLLEEDKTLGLKKDGDGRTALFWAVSFDHGDVANEILKTAKELPRFDIDHEDDAGWTVLHIASAVGNLPFVETLVALGANINAQTNTGQSALHLATSKQHIDIVRFLLANGASARDKNNVQQTALHRAAAVGSLPIVKELINNAKCPLNATDSSTWTALHHATAEGHADVAQLLITSGADPHRKDADGQTCLDVAADSKVLKYLQL